MTRNQSSGQGQWGLVILWSLVIGQGAFSALAASVPLTVTEDAGVARQNEGVTSGLPFPMGLVKTNTPLRLLDERGAELPLQAQTTATWRDGTVKWVLLDFQTDLAAGSTRTFRLEHGEGVRRDAVPAVRIQMEDTADKLWINTGPLRFSISKRNFGILDEAFLDRNHNGRFEPDEPVIETGLRQSLTLARQFAGLTPRVLAPEEIRIEEPGPLRGVVKVSGWIEDGAGNRLAQYVVRVQAHAGSQTVQLSHTLVQLSSTIKMLWLRHFALTLQPKLGPDARFIMGGQPGAHRGILSTNSAAALVQLQEGSYAFRQTDGATNHGFKAPGWVEVSDGQRSVLVGNRFFWQQFPKTLTVSYRGIGIGLFPAESPRAFDLDQGLAKTHEILVRFDAGPREVEQCAQAIGASEHPLFAIAPVPWYCDSKVFDELLPFDFDRFPDYETLTEASGDQYIKKMATGWRNWGDVYYGGEYKGTNSYMNLEYDVHHNFLCQFARTGQRKYLDTAITMAKHQADIDTNHKTGWQWKHSPRHVEIQAEFGHTFTRGLLETYFFTGNRRCLEAALELGDYFARQIQNPRELGNERQIGWGLISLLPVYEATWDSKYFIAASNTVERLLRGIDARGKFDIRWDNRIAFFNGIAATGFIYYYRATGDERVADAAWRVIHRARGFYPEYAGRTLEAIAWACQRGRDPDDLDFLIRTWEATMAKVISWNVMDLGAPTIFTMHALPFIATSSLLPKADLPLVLTPAQFATENGLYAHHLPSGDADLYLDGGAEPFTLAIVRKGAWKGAGTALLYDSHGSAVRKLEFPKEGALWQRKAFAVRPGQGPLRLVLRSTTVSNVKGGSFVTWDVVTSRPMPAVFSLPNYEGLHLVTPQLFTVPQGGSAKIELELTGEGEGFKKAVIYDPQGNVAASLEAFIDLGDTGRYHYRVSASILPEQMNGLWSLSLQDVTATRITGLSPYFATSKRSFFRPDKAPSPPRDLPVGD